MTRTMADTLLAACANPKMISGGLPGDFQAKKQLATVLKAKMRESRRYHITDEVTASATLLGLHHPRILKELLYRARPPYDKTWIDWSPRVQGELSGARITENTAERTGCFVERMSETGFRIIGIEGQKHGIGLSNAAIYYDVLQPVFETNPALAQSTKDISRIANLPYEQLQRGLVGSAYLKRFDGEDDDDEEKANRKLYCDDLTRHAGWMFNPLLANYHRDNFMGKFDHLKFSVLDQRTQTMIAASGAKAFQHTVQNSVVEYAGVWRMVISLLCLLNEQTFVQHETKTFGNTRSQVVNGHLVPYVEQVLVTLRLSRKIIEEKMVRMLVDSIPKRQQHVAGSFRQWHKRGDPNCNHPYIDVTPTRKRCPLCGHAIWWADQYKRGDERLGTVLKDRLVTQ